MELPRPDLDRAADLRRLADRGNRRTVRAGEVLFHQGSTSTNVAVIEAGLVKVSYDDEHGRTTLITLLGRGTVIGEVGVITGQQRTSRVESLTTATVSFVAASVFVQTLLDVPALSLDLIDQIVGRQRRLNQARNDRDGLDVASRIANHLLRVQPILEPPNICPLSHEELASWVGAARPQVSEAVGGLRDLGLVETSRRRIEILDPEGLEAFVADAGDPG